MFPAQIHPQLCLSVFSVEDFCLVLCEKLSCLSTLKLIKFLEGNSSRWLGPLQPNAGKTVHTASEEFKYATTTLWICVWGTVSGKTRWSWSHSLRKPQFPKCFLFKRKEKLAFSYLSDLESVFEKIRFCDGTLGLTRVEIKLRFKICSPAEPDSFYRNK